MVWGYVSDYDREFVEKGKLGFTKVTHQELSDRMSLSEKVKGWVKYLGHLHVETDAVPPQYPVIMNVSRTGCLTRKNRSILPLFLI